MPTTHFIWDPVSDNLLMETDGNGNTIAEYTHEPGLHGQLISQHRNGQTSYYHYDGEGNTRAVTDQNGNVVETASYSAFGEVVEKTSSIVNPFGYRGALGYYANPTTNDLDVRARIYRPVIARWLSADSFALLTGDTNLYWYVKNSPLTLADPSGLQPESQCGDKKEKCAGACMHGKDATLQKCNITKLEVLEGSDLSCSAITKQRICDELKKWIERENKANPGKEWAIRKCSGGDKCDCGQFTLKPGKQTIDLKDEIIDSTGKIYIPIPVIGEVEVELHCILKLSGKFEVTGGGFAMSRCELKDK